MIWFLRIAFGCVLVTMLTVVWRWALAGQGGMVNLTLQELGDRFGISRERVRQLEQRLTIRLREYLKGEMGDAAEAS